MEYESLTDQLKEVLLQIEASRTSIEKGHEKFHVAITGALRLLNENTPILDNLQGSPDDLKAYVLKLFTELRMDTVSHWESLHEKLGQILAGMSTFHDRKS